MNRKIKGKLGAVYLNLAITVWLGAMQATPSAAQDSIARGSTTRAEARPEVGRARAFAYDAKRETILEGIVVSYTENAQFAPTGAHVTVRTTTGDIDVHLGPASYLRGKHFSLSTGEQVRFSGVNTSRNGKNVFLARTAQKGNQVVMIRSPRGSLLAIGAARLVGEAERAQMKQQGGAR